MGFLMQKTERSQLCRYCGLAMLLLACLGCVSCGPQVIKGRTPLISISGMSMVEENLSADFSVSNQNGVPMTITSIDITVVVNDVELTRHNSDFKLTIDANSIEDVHVEKLPNDFTRSLLASLDSGELKSLPFDLQGKVITIEEGTLRFAHKGYLYPVPGKPGYYRSAVTQARDLRREEPY